MANPKKFGLDGKEYTINLKSKPRDNASKLHTDALKIIKETCYGASILEEVPIQLGKYRTLYLDVYLPILNIVFEVHGKQHFEHTEHFTKTRQEFLKLQYRDKQKEEWCRINDIQFVELRWDQQDRWRSLIEEAFKRS